MKNYGMTLGEGSFESYGQEEFNEIKNNKNCPIFGGLGPNFVICANWPKLGQNHRFEDILVKNYRPTVVECSMEAQFNALGVKKIIF